MKSLGHQKLTPGLERARRFDVERASSFVKGLDAEPQRLAVEDVRCLIMSAVMSGASDITFQSDQAPRFEINGILYRGMQRPLSPSEVIQILTETYGAANGITEINGRKVLDYSYELNIGQGGRQRFRVNATGIYGRDGSGVELTLRALPQQTPDLAMVKINQDELKMLTPRQGIVLICGATGSGKSTTMAAITRHHLEQTDEPKKIVDIQKPIEYTFRDVTSRLMGSASTIGQSEVGRHIESFAEGVHSALRRKPHIINVGEARDYETIAASLEASLTGHLVYTTTHAGTVGIAIRRMLSAFPASERSARAYDMIAAVQFIMTQHLVPTIDGRGRVPVREYLAVDDSLRSHLLRMGENDWAEEVDAIVNKRAGCSYSGAFSHSLTENCRQMYRDGIISLNDALRLGGPAAISEK